MPVKKEKYEDLVEPQDFIEEDVYIDYEKGGEDEAQEGVENE